MALANSEARATKVESRATVSARSLLRTYPRPLVGAVILILWMVWSTMPATAQPSISEETALAWIEAFNGGEEAMAVFRAKHAGEGDDWKPRFQRMRAELGALEVYGVMEDGSGLKLGVDSENQGQLRIGFDFDPDQPDRIAGLSIEEGGGGPGGDLPEFSFAGEDWSERAAEVDAYVAALAEDHAFSGVVLIADPSGVLLERAYGLASREFGVPNRLDTRFDVGSINKDYTHLAIRQLEAARRLSRNDKVGKHLPGYPNQRVRDEVTIQHLLDHTSGLGDYFTEEYWTTPMRVLREIEDYLPIWGPKPLLGEPGKRFSYSNLGYTVLGAIIEKASGTSYPEYIEAKVFGPAAMASSGFFEVDRPVPNVAVGYTKIGPDGEPGEGIYKNIFLEPVKGGPWGKSYSTARDLYHFYSALLSDRLVEREHNWFPWSSDWIEIGAALAGGGPGLNAMVRIEQGLMVIAVANLDPPAAGALAEVLWQAASTAPPID